MPKHIQAVRLKALKPRNKVIRALITMGRSTSAWHADGQRRLGNHDRNDLAQRVRETGEW